MIWEMHGVRKSGWLYLAGACWAAAVLAGFSLLTIYKGTAGEATAAPATWPADSRIERATDGPTLIVFAHPHCVCTRATIAELAHLMARAPMRPRLYVAFHLPKGAKADWRDTDLWKSAARIDGARAFADEDG